VLAYTGLRYGEAVGGKAPIDWRRVFDRAVVAAGLGITAHKLRHTAASLAIASGADVKVVQTMLGTRR
jgi:integrase